MGLIKVYEAFRKTMQPEDAKVIVEFIEEQIKQTKEQIKKDYLTTDKLEATLGKLKTTTILWMVVLWIGQVSTQYYFNINIINTLGKDERNTGQTTAAERPVQGRTDGREKTERLHPQGTDQGVKR